MNVNPQLKSILGSFNEKPVQIFLRNKHAYVKTMIGVRAIRIYEKRGETIIQTADPYKMVWEDRPQYQFKALTGHTYYSSYVPELMVITTDSALHYLMHSGKVYYQGKNELICLQMRGNGTIEKSFPMSTKESSTSRLSLWDFTQQTWYVINH